MFDQKIADEICRRLADGETLRTVCKTEGFPSHSTVCRWTLESEDFANQYARAMTVSLDVMADEILEICDSADYQSKEWGNAAVQEARLRVDTRKWLLSKRRPEKYGDRLHQVVSDPQGQPLKLEIVHIHGKDEKPAAR